MKIFSAMTGATLTLCLQGELDHHASREAMKKIDLFLEDKLPHELRLDCSELSFMDSSGIALLLRVSRRMAELGGRFSVEQVNGQPRRVLDASGLDRLVAIR